MLESFRRSLGTTIARLQFRRRGDTVVSFTDSFSKGKRGLVVLPLTPSPHSLQPVLEFLRRTIGETRLTVVAEEHDSSVATVLPRAEVVRISIAEINRLYLPTRPILQRITARQYDVAVDLNLDFLLPSGYICRASNARIRAGFLRPGADLFYNLQVQAVPGEGRSLYDRFASCLQMFACSTP